MSRRDELMNSARNIIDHLNATKAAKEKLRVDIRAFDDNKLEEWIKEQRKPKEDSSSEAPKEDSSSEAPKESPAKEIPKPPPPFTVPLKELLIGKAGVSDLFAKQNEVIKYLNALSSKPKVP